MAPDLLAGLERDHDGKALHNLYFAIDLDSSLVERRLKDAPVDVLEMAGHFFGRHRLVKVWPAKLSDASQQGISRKAEVVPGMMFGCRGHSGTLRQQ
jgi:hypothetical protein